MHTNLSAQVSQKNNVPLKTKGVSTAIKFPSAPVFQRVEEEKEPGLKKDEFAGNEKQSLVVKKSNLKSNNEEQKNRNAIAATMDNLLFQRKVANEEEGVAPFHLKTEEDDGFQLKKEDIAIPFKPLQKKENKTGLPDTLKTGIENLSGFSMDDADIHYNSDKPAQLNALAYAQGTDIHVAPSQEKHLPHEAWHVVQQKQGRVNATMQMKTGIAINDDASLEYEADVMGVKAAGRDSRISTEAIQHFSMNRSLLQLRKTTKPSDAEGQRTLIADIGLKS